MVTPDSVPLANQQRLTDRVFGVIDAVDDHVERRAIVLLCARVLLPDLTVPCGHRGCRAVLPSKLSMLTAESPPTGGRDRRLSRAPWSRTLCAMALLHGSQSFPVLATMVEDVHGVCSQDLVKRDVFEDSCELLGRAGTLHGAGPPRVVPLPGGRVRRHGRRRCLLWIVAAHASTVSPSSVVGAARAAGMARPPTPLGALTLAASVGQQCRPARRAFWPRVVAIANPSHPVPPAPD